MERKDLEGGASEQDVIHNFMRSDEYIDKYGYTPGISEPPADSTPIQHGDPGPQTQTTYGGGDASTNYISDQTANDAAQTESANNITHTSTESTNADE